MTTRLPIEPRTVAGTASTAPPSAAPAIRAESLGVRYGRQIALQDVSLTMPAGAITAIVGPSGCGKSSFLSSLNRLTDLTPAVVTGAVRVGEVDVFSPSTDVIALRRRVGMIFQKPNPFPLSVRRNLTFPLREHGMTGARCLEEAVESSLRTVGLWDEVKDRLESPALALSGGQQQRLCIARALALAAEALLLDEPTSALDPLAGGVIEDLLAHLTRRYTIVVVTHNLAQARRVAERVAVFWIQHGAGTLIEHGPVRQIFEDPRDELTAAYVRGMRG